MERVITAILTNSNDKKVFNSNANTLSELKAEMTAQGIDYSGMDFMEGLTHTTMMDDSSILPTNVQYKGQVTNNLVFMLSTANKNIRSGAYNRAELYAYIKEHNLQDEVKALYGKNYTQVSSEYLADLINKDKAKKCIPTDRKGLYEFIKKNNLQGIVTGKTGKSYTQVSTESLYKICNAAQNKASKAKEDALVKKSTPKKASMNSPYSDAELDAIIDSLRG